MSLILINNLSSRISSCRAVIDEALQSVLDRGSLILGPSVARFEREFAEYVGSAYCSTVASGSDALELALRAVGIRPRDRVATVANAGMYTTTAVLAIGADPFFMDVQLETRVVSSAEVAKALKQNVHAVVVTHLYGQIVPEIEEIQRLCAIAQVPLIEDCAQAHGASLRDKQAGSFGTVGCFSFYPTKNLGALGDGGAVVTDCEELAERVKALRQYGWTSKYRVEHHGARNSRLDELQAAVLSVFLTRLDEWNHRRRAIARQYNAALANSDIHTPNCSGLDYVGHLYVLRTQQRDALRCFLQERGISSDVHYPIPDHRQPIFGERYSDVALRVTEQLCREVLTVPCYPEMSAEEVSTVTTALQNWCKEREISHGLR